MTSHFSILAWRIPWTEELDMTSDLAHTHTLNFNNISSLKLQPPDCQTLKMTM